MVEVKRKKTESFESFFRRFSKRIQQSGKVIAVKQGMHTQPKKNRNAKKKSALVGLKLRKQKEYLRKIGKLVDEPRRRW
ncbi:MAG: hypothetical protein Q8Q23_03285 [bacterium]|nr:hypothetical protein [bacterium]